MVNGLCYDSTANFLVGGDPSASAGNEGLSLSTLHFVPANFDCGESEWEVNILRLTAAGLGGVERADCISGVLEWRPDATSFLSRAAKLFVDTTASAWHVAWNTYVREVLVSKGAHSSCSRSGLPGHPSWLHSSIPNLRQLQHSSRNRKTSK